MNNLNYTKAEIETLKAGFGSPFWVALIRPFEEHVERLGEVITEDEGLDNEQRQNYIRVRKVYRSLVDLPKILNEKESAPEEPNFDPYEK